MAGCWKNSQHPLVTEKVLQEAWFHCYFFFSNPDCASTYQERFFKTNCRMYSRALEFSQTTHAHPAAQGLLTALICPQKAGGKFPADPTLYFRKIKSSIHFLQLSHGTLSFVVIPRKPNFPDGFHAPQRSVSTDL